MKDCEAGTALCGMRIEIEKWDIDWIDPTIHWRKCPKYHVVRSDGIGVVGLRFKCCPLPVDPNISN